MLQTSNHVIANMLHERIFGRCIGRREDLRTIFRMRGSLSSLVQERMQQLVAPSSSLNNNGALICTLDRLCGVLPHLSTTLGSASCSEGARYPLLQPLSSYFDHTLLRNDASRAEIKSLCKEAIANSFFTVCVNSSQGELASGCLAASRSAHSVKLCCVVGFPLGASTTSSKAFEAAQAVLLGAEEVDMVINLSWLKDSLYDLVYNDIKQVVTEAKKQAGADKVVLKVILETAQLSASEIIDGCLLSALAGADFVKTSTGFSSKGGATTEAVEIMRFVVGNKLGVKASGGIRTAHDARSMIAAGATRLGVSASLAILDSDKDLAAASPRTSPDAY